MRSGLGVRGGHHTRRLGDHVPFGPGARCDGVHVALHLGAQLRLAQVEAHRHVAGEERAAKGRGVEEVATLLHVVALEHLLDVLGDRRVGADLLRVIRPMS